jgi:hypothetical protein
MTLLTDMEYLCHKWPRYVPLVVNISRSFPRSWLITGVVTRLTRRVSLVEQELPTLPEHLSSPSLFSGVRVTRSLVLYVCFVDLVCPFILFLLAIVFSALLRYTNSDYPFSIFKLFVDPVYPRSHRRPAESPEVSRFQVCNPFSVVCFSSIYGFCWPLLYLLALLIVLMNEIVFLISQRGWLPQMKSLFEINEKYPFYLSKLVLSVKLHSFKHGWSVKEKPASHFNSLNTKRPRHRSIEIRVLVWNRYTDMAGWNWFLKFQSPSWYQF